MITLHEMYMKAGISEAEEWAKEVNIIYPGGKDPYPHQITGLSLAAYHTRFGLYDEQGCGKSLISHALTVWYSSMGNKCIVLMEPHLLHQYYSEFHEVLNGVGKHCKMRIYQGTPKKRAGMRQHWESEGFPDILLMTYNIFRMAMNTPNDIKNNRANPVLMWQYLKRKDYSVLVADEATIVKSPSSTTHKACHQFLGREGETALMLMTGTPSENALVDLYGLIRLVNPRAYGSKGSFDRCHVVYNPYTDFPQIEGYKNLDLLEANLYAKGRRVEKKDVLKDLPEKIYTEYEVKLDPKHLALYKKLAKERLLELKDRIIDAELEQSLRPKLMQIVCNPDKFCDDKIVNEPLNMCEKLVESIGANSHKIMIYIYQKATAEAVMKRFEHLNPVLVNSTTSGKKQKNIDTFKFDDSCRLLVVNYLSGGTGLNFQEVCSHMIFLEPISIPGKFFQATDRIHRGNMKAAANYYIITSMGTVAVDIRNSMISKHANNSIVTRDSSTIRAALMGESKIKGSFKKLDTVQKIHDPESELVNFETPVKVKKMLKSEPVSNSRGNVNFGIF